MTKGKEKIEVKRLTHSEITKCLYDLRVEGGWFNNPNYIDLIKQLAIIEQGKTKINLNR